MDIDGKRVAIVSLYSRGGLAEDGCLYVGCGVYEEGGKWTGESLNGNIPQNDLVRWGIEKGFLKFEQRERG